MAVFDYIPSVGTCDCCAGVDKFYIATRPDNIISSSTWGTTDILTSVTLVAGAPNANRFIAFDAGTGLTSLSGEINCDKATYTLTTTIECQIDNALRRVLQSYKDEICCNGAAVIVQLCSGSKRILGIERSTASTNGIRWVGSKKFEMTENTQKGGDDDTKPEVSFTITFTQRKIAYFTTLAMTAPLVVSNP